MIPDGHFAMSWRRMAKVRTRCLPASASSVRSQSVTMGGMLALRYALMSPREMAGLVVVNPIGLEDWKAKGVPFVTIDQLYERELKTSFESIKKNTSRPPYYGGEWKPNYDRW